MNENDKKDLRDVFNSIISISDLRKGKTSEILQRVQENNDHFIIVKNNKPQAVIISVKEYIELMEVKEQHGSTSIIDTQTEMKFDDDYFKKVKNEFKIKKEEMDILMSDDKIH